MIDAENSSLKVRKALTVVTADWTQRHWL